MTQPLNWNSRELTQGWQRGVTAFYFGLGAAVRLRELGKQDGLIFEASHRAGGLAASSCDVQGFTWDLGSHLSYSHYDRADRCWDKALAPDG
jgi:phytoene dehydrogenase-like protein